MGWVIPIFCMALACGVVLRQNVAFQVASSARDAANRHVEKASTAYQDAKKAPDATYFAAAADTPTEQAEFLNGLRKILSSEGVVLRDYNSQVLIYGKDRGVGPTDPGVLALLKGIEKRTCTLSLTGPYAGLRNVLEKLELSERLYTIGNVSWTRTDKGILLTLVVGRYVEPAKPEVAPAPAPPAK